MTAGGRECMTAANEIKILELCWASIGISPLCSSWFQNLNLLYTLHYITLHYITLHYITWSSCVDVEIVEIKILDLYMLTYHIFWYPDRVFTNCISQPCHFSLGSKISISFIHYFAKLKPFYFVKIMFKVLKTLNSSSWVNGQYLAGVQRLCFNGKIVVNISN